MTDDIVRVDGSRIVYVDPNEVFGYGGEKGENSVPITPPYEDMCIAFNLIIEQYDRFDANQSKEISLTWTDKPNGKSSYFSVLDGDLKTKNEKGTDDKLDYDNSYLTTYYTEISSDGYKKQEMVEGLGVTSIQVSFESYYTPTVTIQFVDVRGSALFGREEAIHSSQYGTGTINSNNIFGAFFTQPYPKFRLQMKGFYGKDVTYQLTCSGCKAKFNAKTGNVEITANFIGYTWAMLTDIPLAYLIAAPYCNYVGEDYWNKHVNSEEWRLDNNPAVGATSTAPPRLYEFFDIIQTCIKEANNKSNNTDSRQLAVVQTQRQKLDELSGYIKSYDNAVSNYNKNKETIKDAEKDNKITEINSHYHIIYNFLQNNAEDLNLFKLTEEDCFSKKEENGINEYTITFDTTNLRNSISGLISSYNKQSEEAIRETKKEFIKEALKKIKIDPNIHNIFKILMCHLETFCHIMFEAGKQIKQQQDVNERTPAYLGVDIENTDMPSRFTSTTNLPPWTAVFNNKGETTINHNELDYSSRYQWIGDLKESDRWIEKRVVWSLQNAIQKIQPGSNSSLPTIFRDPNTIFNLPSDINLYGNDSRIFRQLVNDKSGFDNLCGALGIRAAQLFGIMDENLDQNINLVKLMGEIDAYNFYISISNIDDIKSGLLEHVKGDLSDTVLDCLTCNNSDNDKNYSYNNGYHVFEYENIKNNRQPMFEQTENGYKYTYFLDKNDIPLIPSVLTKFNDKGYYKYIKLQDPSSNDGKLCYEGVIDDENKSNKWLSANTNKQLTSCINKDMFNIIDDVSNIEDILKRYDTIKNGKFDIKGYEVDNQKGFNDFVNRYWHLDYHKITSNNTLSCNLIGESMFKDKDVTVNDFNNKITDSQTVWNALHCISQEQTAYSYQITDFKHVKNNEGNNLAVNNDLYVKSITVKDNNENDICSLFAHPLYYMQSIKGDNRENGLKARAFLFLQSLPRGCDFNNSFFTTHSNLTIYNKLNVLYLGGLLWRASCDKEPIVCVQNNLKYKIFANKKDGLYVSDEDSGITDANTTISTLLNTLNIDNNIKNQLIKYFNDFVNNIYVKIDSLCQLHDGVNNFEDGFSLKNWLDGLSESEDKKYYNTNYFCGYYRKNIGLDLIFKQDEYELQKMFKDILFGRVIIMNNGPVGKHRTNNSVIISSNVFKSYLNTFKSTLEKIHKQGTSTSQEYNTTGLTDNIDTDKNILQAVYLYCKNIWEKWLMPMSGASFTSNPNNQQSKNRLELYEEHYDVKNFFKKFKFVDSYYVDISTLLKINLDVLYKSYEERSKESSLHTFIGDIVSKHNCLFVSLPDYLDLGLTDDNDGGLQKMRDMFKPLPYSAMGAPQMENNFVVMYTYPPASRMPAEFSHRSDGFDIYSTDSVPNWFKSATREGIDNNGRITKYGYNVPSFCIAFAKQNNHLFKEFNISMENPVETENSIHTLTNIANIAKGGERRVAFCGQDIYNIFTNYSYIVEVEMMGNAQIQPLMYFQLMNIPMWRGAYMIFNVTHNMTPGNMTTKIKAMKMSKNPVPFVSKWWSFIPDAYFNGYDNILGGSDIDPSMGYLQKFKESGRFSSIEIKSATPYNFIEGTDRSGSCKNDARKAYYNCGSNNYFSPDNLLTTYNFKLKDGSDYNLKKVINFIYNHSHIAEHYYESKKKDEKGNPLIIINACDTKKPTQSIGRCAEYVFSAVGNGFNKYERLGTGNAWDKELNKNTLNKYFEFKSINEVDIAYPGDIVLQTYIDSKGKQSGHATMFTGMHWVSDFIQRDGLYSAGNGNGIYAVYRIPGIEKYIKSSYTPIPASEAFNKWFKWSRSWEGSTNGIVGSTNTDVNYQRNYALNNFWNKFKLDNLRDPYVAIISMYVIYWTGNPSFIIRALNNEPFEYGKWGYSTITNEQINQMNNSDGKTLFNKIKKMCGNYVLHPWGASLKNGGDFTPGWRRRWSSISYGLLQSNEETKSRVSEDEVRTIMAQL